MTKQLIIFATAVLAPAAVYAQGFQPAWPAFEQRGWMRFPPDLGVTSVHQSLEGQTGPVVARPLSADEVRTTTQTLSDGSHINHNETNRFYRDGRGRMRIETETGAVIYDPIAGFTYDLTKATKNYTRSTISANATVTIAAAAHQSSISSHSSTSYGASGKQGKKEASSSRDQKPSNTETEDLAPQTINGSYSKGSRVTSTIPAGAMGNDRDLKVVNERWYSDDLKLLVKSSNSDPRFGATTYELRNIVQAEPDPSMFQVPADYVLGH